VFTNFSSVASALLVPFDVTIDDRLSATGWAYAAALAARRNSGSRQAHGE